MWPIGVLSRKSSRQQENSQDCLKKFEPITANGTSFDVEVIATGNKNSYASIRKGAVVIKVPRWLGTKKSQEVATACI
jgi:hypothetical protein